VKPTAHHSRPGELLLVVDDDDHICTIMTQMLEGLGFRVLTSLDGTEALSIYEKHQAEIALVITDMLMPFMDGSALILALRKINPWVPVIAMSGFAAQRAKAEQAGGADTLFLPKPFSLSGLEDKIRTILPRPGKPSKP